MKTSRKQTTVLQSHSLSDWKNTENKSEVMCKASWLLSVWINVSIIFSGQIDGAEEWAVNGKEEGATEEKDAFTPKPTVIGLTPLSVCVREAHGWRQTFNPSHWQHLRYSSCHNTRRKNTMTWLVKALSTHRVQLSHPTQRILHIYTPRPIKGSDEATAARWSPER